MNPYRAKNVKVIEVKADGGQELVDAVNAALADFSRPHTKVIDIKVVTSNKAWLVMDKSTLPA